jgi:acyl-CoA reductase-like NAD-dependent aldehyde dehydrogenase
MSTERILVHSSIAEPFSHALKETTTQIFGPNSPTPVLVSSIGVSKNKALLSNAISKGASVILGDPNSSEDVPTKMRPVIVGNITKDMDLYYTESFGPTVSLYTFETEEEALALANDTDYGLAGSVFTEDLAAGLRVAKGYETGAVHINSMSVHDESALPHGGVKKSGFGRFNGAQGLEEFVRTKTVTWKD